MLIIKLAPRLGLVKEPTSRCSHIKPTPRGGGLAFVITSLLAMTVCYWSEAVSGSQLSVLLCGGTIIAALGFCDDIFQLSIKKRMSIQVLIIAASLYSMSPLPALEFWGVRVESNWLLWGVSTLALAWWLNLFNFMDGIDGLAGTQAVSMLISAIVLICAQYSGGELFIPSLMLILTSALLGFLKTNWPPAKIFMGDVGSTFLGYILGMMAVMTIINGSLNLWVWLILPGVFWVDATFTLLRRMLKGDRWYQAHQSHTYQRVSRYLEEREGQDDSRHRAHRKVTLTVLGLNVCWLFPLASAALVWPAWGLPLVAVAWLPLVSLAWLAGAGKQGNIPLTNQDTRSGKKLAIKERIWLRI